MFKRLLATITIVFFVFLLLGCDEIGSSEYQIWRNSADAEDLNGDRKIDELDYDLFLNPQEDSYETWRTSDDAYDYNEDRKIDELVYEFYIEEIEYIEWLDSDDAEDLNEDRKIDRLDYEIFLEGPKSDYEIWAESNAARDLNDDDKIDELDYAIYIEYSEFKGTYTLSNYTYEGYRFYVGNDLFLDQLGTHMNQIKLEVDQYGQITADLSNSTISILGDDFAYVLEALNNMTITRISKFLIGIDTSITYEDLTMNVTLYLKEDINGFTTSYTVNSHNKTGTMTFDIIKDTTN